MSRVPFFLVFAFCVFSNPSFSKEPDLVSNTIHYTPEEIHFLAVDYINGNGVTKNLREAHRLLRISAGQGYGPSLFSLGFLYEQGDGVEVDLNMATKFYEKAVDLGDLASMNNLAVILSRPANLESHHLDRIEALFHTSALGGNMNARDNISRLADRIARGLRVKEDVERAVKLFLISGSMGNIFANDAICMTYRDTKYASDVEVFESCKRASEIGESVIAKSNLAYHYAHGLGTKQNDSLAYNWYVRAIDDGWNFNLWELGFNYYYDDNDDIIPKTYSLGRLLLEESHRRGNAEASFTLGRIEWEDYNPEEAAIYFKTAMNRGQKDAADALRFAKQNSSVANGDNSHDPLTFGEKALLFTGAVVAAGAINQAINGDDYDEPIVSGNDCRRQIEAGYFKCEAKTIYGSCSSVNCQQEWDCYALRVVTTSSGSRKQQFIENGNKYGKCKERRFGPSAGSSSYVCDPSTGKEAEDVDWLVAKVCQ